MKDTLDFIIVGAQKAGTTSLFEHLRRHPELALPADKEVPYFSHDETIERGWEDYLRRSFFHSDPSLKWGTVTPQYMLGGLWEPAENRASTTSFDERTVPARIRASLPDVRLAAILRDPAERAYSHYRMAVLYGWETRSFDQAIDELLRPAELARLRKQPRDTTGYVTLGEYGRILTPYFDIFPREQLLVLFTADLASDPAQLLRRLHAFIGVDAEFMPDTIEVRYRIGATQQRFSWLGHEPLTRVQLAMSRSAVARRAWHSLPYAARRRIDYAMGRMTRTINLRNRRSTNPDTADADDARTSTTLARLRSHYQGDAAVLATLLGERPRWLPAGAAVDAGG